MSSGWWSTVSGGQLAQGDLLFDCQLPVFFGLRDEDDPNAVHEIPVVYGRLIVVTQSCDLENSKVELVALCQVLTLPDFEEENPAYRARGKWESVRQGRVVGLHLLASPSKPDDNREALVVDFGHIVSLPIEYLSRHAESLGERPRLNSPYLEHFSQGLARFFMRVGLPSAIPPYK